LINNVNNKNFHHQKLNYKIMLSSFVLISIKYTSIGKYMSIGIT